MPGAWAGVNFGQGVGVYPAAGLLDHDRSKQSILVWVWICVGALRVVEGRL